jgi:predicted dehydrogenase
VSNKKIKLGIIGAGANTRSKHIPEFQKIKDIEITGIANRSIESSQKVAKEFNIPTAYNTWQELLASPDIDAVCIGTWPYMHEILVIEALNQGKHILTEARMSMDTAQARNMLDAAYLKPELVTQIVPAPFIDTIEMTVLDLINSDYLGDILAADLSGIPGFAANSPSGGFIDNNAPFMWRHDRDLSGYNIMLMGAWYECMMRLLGPAITVITH